MQNTALHQEAYAQGQLHLSLTDSNGFVQPGKADISGCLDGYLVLNRHDLLAWLQQQAGRRWQLPLGLWLTLEQARFDANGFPALALRIHWARGQLSQPLLCSLSLSEKGALLLHLQPFFWPMHLIWHGIASWLQQIFEQKIQQPITWLELQLECLPAGPALQLRPLLTGVLVPLREGNYLRLSDWQPLAGHFCRDAERNLRWVFDQQAFSASSDPLGQRGQSWDQADQLELNMQLFAWRNGAYRVDLKGQLSLHLSEAETRRIQLQGLSLSSHIQQLGLELAFDSRADISPERHLQVQAQNNWQIKELQVMGHRYQVDPTDLLLRFDSQRGLELNFLNALTSPAGTYTPQLAPHALKLIIGGPAYLAAMLAAIGAARRWIDLESFLYFPGQTTRRLTQALALKAAGLCESADGELQMAPDTPQGIPVFVLFSNLELTPAGSEPVLAMFAEVKQALLTRLNTVALSPRQRQQAARRLLRNLQYASYVEGVVRSDHRKLLIVDGELGFVGGINLGDKFLAADSFHDLMLAFSGPALIKAQQAFMDNWWRVRGAKQPHPLPRSLSVLKRRTQRYASHWNATPAAADILLTDARQSEIAWAIHHIIGLARQQIWLEHAYFYHPQTLRALQQALQRGVTVRIIVPEDSNIAIFNPTNTDAIRELMQTQFCYGQGQVEAWLYTGPPGTETLQFSQMAHSKAISVDQRYAVIGSANLTSRSLQSPFKEALAGDAQTHLFFNQEMNLFIDDPAFVSALDDRLFGHDSQTAARRVSFRDVLERLQQLGGLRALRAAQNQARLA